MIVSLLFIYLPLLVLVLGSPASSGQPDQSGSGNSSDASLDADSHDYSKDEQRIYEFNKCHGAGCPYTASWLVHVNLLKRSHWWLDSTKMEAASFIIFDTAHLKFQVGDPDAYYVHHMSMFEHLLHKKKGFDVAKIKTLTMSEMAFDGECGNLKPQNTREFIGIIPFYGGLPPNVTGDLRVKSLGQGNSLVDAGTKALQCMATLCSVLKYYGQAVIGVARQQDQELIIKMIDKAGADVRRRTHIVRFEMNKPAHLPFHLIGWTQDYIREYNCKSYNLYPNINVTAGAPRKLLDRLKRRVLRHVMGDGSHNHGSHKKRLHSLWAKHGTKPYASEDIFEADSDAFGLCNVDFTKHHHGDPIKLVFHRKAITHMTSEELKNCSDYNELLDGKLDMKIAGSSGAGGKKAQHPINHFHPIRYVYYTESDQIVKFDSMSTFHAISSASNDTTFFVGRRREKQVDSNETDYMGSLNAWRNCGAPGFSLHWPKETLVRQG